MAAQEEIEDGSDWRGLGTLGLLRALTTIAPQEPWVQLTVGFRLTDFLVDSGAAYSVLNGKLSALTKTTVPVVGVTRLSQEQPLLQPLECKLGEKTLTHSFLYMPDRPIPLLGRDILWKLNAQITFFLEKQMICFKVSPDSALLLQQELDQQEKQAEPIPEYILQNLNKTVWVDGVPGQAWSATLINIQLKQGATTPQKKQYP